MSRTHIALAVALAVSFGVTKPTTSPIREVPLSKSDILIAENASGQGSARGLQIGFQDHRERLLPKVNRGAGQSVWPSDGT